ncbi:MAG: IS110 family transposase [Acidimicrobiia bacterium]|nr:IS110 family transposase [Acidimicrobiia bacterium]
MTIVIGIDPHKASHTAVAVDVYEQVLDSTRLAASVDQIEHLQRWAAEFDDRTWAVESAHGLGLVLSQQLVAAGETVIDVPPALAARTRLLGSGRSQKNDHNDALSIAISALRHHGLNTVRPEAHAQILKMMAKRHRDLSRLKNQAASRLHALLLDLVPGGLAGTMHPSKARDILDSLTVGDAMAESRVELATELIDDIERLGQQITRSKKRLQSAVSESGTSLVSIVGVGPVCAALIIGNVGDVSRFRTAGHFASYNGTAPLEASSGDRRRHRLNPHGNRQLNYALHIIAIGQLRCGGPGQAFYDRKVTEGKSHKEALRSLKRHLSNVVFRALLNDAAR